MYFKCVKAAQEAYAKAQLSLCLPDYIMEVYFIQRHSAMEWSNKPVLNPACAETPSQDLRKGLISFVVTCPDDRLDIAADVEVTFDLDLERVAGGHEIFEDYVYDMFVKDLYVAK